MALSPRIELRQSQSLTMTPQLQQAIKLLQMSNLQLAEYLIAEVEKNPLLEFAPPAVAPVARGAMPDGGVRRSEGDGSYLDTLAADVSLYEHLRRQIGAMRGSADVVEAALILADELEEDGYLRVPLVEVAIRHRLRAADVLAGLKLVQACDPCGVGARDLKECLALQLADRDRLDPAMRSMLENLALVARGRADELQARCGVDAEDIAEMLAELRALDPKPGLRFARLAGPERRSRRACPACARRWLDGGTQHRDAAAGALEQRLCRAHPGRGRRHPRLCLRVQRQRQLAGAEPGAAGADHPQGGDRDRGAAGPLLQRGRLGAYGP